ncbi:hypothetical protein [Chitinimonas koreensis]|uniref:hypothetical protein n=1 Tax=Chitinimonas koreensis TaxID=356302 RepID=UPI001653F89F|nr:hypothetical protein [Chitinimonas koreensis]QNM95463.1 hypothetical protein H9L41_16545 [Chitinimonas koreensis]
MAVLANNETPIQLASTRPQPIDLNSLVWPPCLAHRQEHRSARNAVHDLARGLPHAAFQAVLDEMTFINRTKSIKSPVGLARTLLSCVRNGTFSPNGADLVLEQRQQAQRNAADRAKQHEHWKRAALQKATAPRKALTNPVHKPVHGWTPFPCTAASSAGAKAAELQYWPDIAAIRSHGTTARRAALTRQNDQERHHG